MKLQQVRVIPPRGWIGSESPAKFGIGEELGPAGTPPL
jgi:hypothetical protein